MTRCIAGDFRTAVWAAPLLVVLLALHPAPARAGDAKYRVLAADSGDIEVVDQADAAGLADFEDQVEAEDLDEQSASSAWLGVWLDAGKNGEGVTVRQVLEGSPAEAAGLKEGDEILSFGDTDTADVSSLTRAVRERKPGDRVALKVLRDGRQETINVVLAKRETRMKIIRIPGAQGTRDEVYKEIARSLSGLREMAAPPRTWVGVAMTELTPDLRKHFGAPGDQGVLIATVRPASPAERAGVQVGDLIIEVGGQAIDTPSDVADAIRDSDSGDKVKVGLVRDGMKKTVEVTLAARPGGDKRSAQELEVEALQEHLRHAAPAIGGPAGELRQRMEALQAELDDLGRRLDALTEGMHSRRAPRAPTPPPARDEEDNPE